MNLLRSCLIAFSMYSKIPVPETAWTKENMKYALCFFPFIGVVIGGCLILWHGIAEYLRIGTNLHTVVFLLIPVLITGGIHLDGFFDTADALSSYKSAKEKREILKDPHVGAFAVIAGIGYFLLSFGIWSEAATREIQVLAIGFVLSRALSGFAVVTFSKAQNTGLAATFSEMSVTRTVQVTMLLYIGLCSLGMVWLRPVTGLAGLFGAGLTFLYYRRMSYQKFGGITGDLAGFFLQICELAMALCAVGTALLFYRS